MGCSVRRATADDIGWLTGELRAFSRFYGTDKPLFGDEAHVAATLPILVRDHLVLIAESPTDRLGFIGAIVTPHMFNPQIRTLVEMFWWVSEAHRGTRAAVLLLDAYLAYGRENADWVTMALEHHSPVSDKHLIKRGFRCRERSYLLEVS